MSDLSPALNALRRSTTQLPVHVYFDEQLYKEEQKRIFQSGPRYLGHALSVPEVGDYYALPQEQEGRVLVRTPQGIELFEIAPGIDLQGDVLDQMEFAPLVAKDLGIMDTIHFRA